MKRTGGIKSWGRGFKAPNLCPNIRVQIVDCFIEENNHIAKQVGRNAVCAFASRDYG